jgi:hypothetical protein
MANNDIPELDKLYSEIRSYRSTKEFRNLLEFIIRFNFLGPYNAALVYRQRPGSKYVATPSVWRNKYGRNIRPGACPLVILRPFGPVGFVFELKDTEGKPVPEEVLNPFRPQGKIADGQYDNLINSLKGAGIGIFEGQQGTLSAGFCNIDHWKREENISWDNKIIRTKILYDIVVNKNSTKEEKFATILHETGHILCGHLGTPNPKWWPDRSYLNKNAEIRDTQMEFEAEVICWLVCGRFGINNPSPRYLIDHLDPNGEIPYFSEEMVLKVSGSVESMITGIKEPRKELIIAAQ